jgi:polysaccharide pyruvyl transferase WcaK-like protein
MGASLETNNRGVSALAASQVKLVSETMPNSRICFFIGSRSSGKVEVDVGGKKVPVDIINHRLSPKAPLKEHILWIFFLAICYRIAFFDKPRQLIIGSNARLRMLAECSFVGEIRGGDSFSDIYGFRRFMLGCLPVLISLVLGRPTCLMPQTYGPYKGFVPRLLAGFIIRKCSIIFARDMASLETAQTLAPLVGSVRIRFCPDVAFELPALEPRTPVGWLSDNRSEPLIGINVNGLMYNGGYTRSNMFGLLYDYQELMHNLVSKLIKETDANLLFVPHTYGSVGDVESDPEACREVVDGIEGGFPGRIHLLDQEYDQSELKFIIGKCDFFIGSRMHACIAAISQCVPTVAIAYSRKFDGVFRSVGIQEMVLDARKLTLDETLYRALDLYTRRDEYTQDLTINITHAKKTLYENFQKLSEELYHNIGTGHYNGKAS